MDNRTDNAPELLLLTVEFAFDLGSGLCWVKTTVHCLLPITDVFQLKIHWTEVLSCSMGV
jgi:hypothetical protein